MTGESAPVTDTARRSDDPGRHAVAEPLPIFAHEAAEGVASPGAKS
jgi:hypothetical protein